MLSLTRGSVESDQLGQTRAVRGQKCRWSYSKPLGSTVNGGNHFLLSLGKPDLRSRWETFHQPGNGPAVCVSAVESFVTAPWVLRSDYMVVTVTQVRKMGAESAKNSKRERKSQAKLAGQKQCAERDEVTASTCWQQMCSLRLYSPESRISF